MKELLKVVLYKPLYNLLVFFGVADSRPLGWLGDYRADASGALGALAVEYEGNKGAEKDARLGAGNRQTQGATQG